MPRGIKPREDRKTIRTHVVSFRVTRQEYEQLEAHLNKIGYTDGVNTFVRDITLDKLEFIDVQ